MWALGFDSNSASLKELRDNATVQFLFYSRLSRDGRVGLNPSLDENYPWKGTGKNKRYPFEVFPALRDFSDFFSDRRPPHIVFKD